MPSANKHNIGLQVTLAQAWNRIDIVKDEVFGTQLDHTLQWIVRISEMYWWWWWWSILTILVFFKEIWVEME